MSGLHLETTLAQRFSSIASSSRGVLVPSDTSLSALGETVSSAGCERPSFWPFAFYVRAVHQCALAYAHESFRSPPSTSPSLDCIVQGTAMQV
eukprot:scaffold260748_cov31-Tisochrysis_lutea.AAC.1